MSDMKAIVYVSSAVDEISHEKIDHLLTKARERNLEHNLSGLLLFIRGNFMQYLEGPSDALDLVYKIIKADTKHKNLIELMHRPIQSRDFSSWSMAYCTKDRTALIGNHDDQEILSGKLGGSSYKDTPARILLHSFWSKNNP